MDKSIRIDEEDRVLLNKMKNKFKEKGIKVTQKDLVHIFLVIGLEDREIFKKLLKNKKLDRKTATEIFFKDKERFDFGDNWLDDIDTTL